MKKGAVNEAGKQKLVVMVVLVVVMVSWCLQHCLTTARQQATVLAVVQSTRAKFQISASRMCSVE